MRRWINWLGLVVLALACLAPAAPASARSGPQRVPSQELAQQVRDQYIVTLKPGTLPAALLKTENIPARFVYTKALNGFAARLTNGQVAALLRRPEIAAIEPDQIVRVANSGQSGGPAMNLFIPWHLDRIDQRFLPLDDSYDPTNTAPQANIYIIDTGIDYHSPTFGEHAFGAYDAFGEAGEDCNGNGTAVASVAGAGGHGVAQRATLWAVRVLDCDGSGTTSQVIAGVNFVAANHRPNAVATMALTGNRSPALNTAVAIMSNSGVFTAVAAGNTNTNACNISPASAPSAITVAASDSDDRRWSLSNYGSCVDLYAPGVDVVAAWLFDQMRGVNGAVSVGIVAGVAALYKAKFGDTTSTSIHNWLITVSTRDVILSNPSETPNRLVYTNGIEILSIDR